MAQNKFEPLRVTGVPEHFNRPWRERAWLHATQPLKYAPVHYHETAEGTGAMTRALANDEVDLAILLTEGALLDIARGGQHRIVKVFVDTPLTWGIHVAANSRFRAIDELQGQRYAISRKGSGSHIMAAVHAASCAWPTDALRFVQVGTLANARRALPASQADIFFWEKTMTEPYVKSGEFRRLDTFESPWPSFVICASDRCLAVRADDVRVLLEEINQLAATLQQSRFATALIAAAYQLKPQAVRTWLASTRWNTGFNVLPEQMAPAVQALSRLWPEYDRSWTSETVMSTFVHDFTS